MKRFVHLFSALTMALTSSIPAQARTCEAYVAAEPQVIQAIEAASPLIPELDYLPELQAEVSEALAKGLLNSLDSEEVSNLKKLEEMIGPVSEFQKAGVILAHRVGVSEAGKDGSPAQSRNYTKDQLRRKVRYLMAVSFELQDRKVILREGIAGRILGAIGGLLVGGPIGAVSGYYIGKKAEQGKLNGTALVTGAVLGAVIDGPFAEDTVVDGALYGAAAGQLVGGDKVERRSEKPARPKTSAKPSRPASYRPLNQMRSYTPATPAPKKPIAAAAPAPKAEPIGGGDWERRFAERPKPPQSSSPVSKRTDDRAALNGILAITVGALVALGILVAVMSSKDSGSKPGYNGTPTSPSYRSPGFERGYPPGRGGVIL